MTTLARKTSKRCTFKGCPKPLAWGGLCNAHGQQLMRGGGDRAALKPLRERGAGGLRLPGLTVSERCAQALAARGPSAYAAARDVLEAWAKRQ